MRTFRLFMLVAIIGFGLGAALAWMTRGGDPTPPPGTEGAEVGDPRPDFRHATLDGDWLEATDFDGLPMLVNFWATWCAPCRREMPVLQAASEQHAGELSVVGLALDDPDPVRDFLEELGIDYPVAVGEADVMRTQRAWGNSAGVLPYTVLVDAGGTIQWQHYGEVTAEELDEVLADWLQDGG
ncbi:TlpA family protein disulfide reductase [Wenzhouxiangella sp. AB-CW3]|uniref:TlpA family protein disulfide reductase n=1 Tax=Wenzhouxiangella sp. AB-CW3 TaxID=2771012 RepID=UPI00168B849D|nr:TlpA disulfide reductase family protein [Wenzhouxiangella sp. AB-CW3]QOC22958.1 TlpA family protein disulfide reductase [Wenzhouxiangella sp. AB-CW3]